MRRFAEGAGISIGQMYQMLAIADIPDDEFEALVDSDAPPTVTELVRLARKRPRPPTRRVRCPKCGWTAREEAR